MKYSAVLFDMDGVIVDTETLWKNAEQKFFRSILPSFDFHNTPDFTGSSLYCVLDFFKKNTKLPFSDEEFLEKRKQYALEKIYSQCEMILGARKALEHISARVLTALGTSSCREWMLAACDRHDLHSFFSVKVSVDDVNKKGKPAPDIFLACAHELGVDPQECIVIEDSAIGIEAARNAGMPVLVLHNDQNAGLDLPEDTERFRHFEELAKILGV